MKDRQIQRHTVAKQEKAKETRSRMGENRKGKNQTGTGKNIRTDGKKKNRRTMEKDRPEGSILKEVLSTSLYLLTVLVVTYLIICYVGQRTEVEGSSMEPTLQDGDNLIVDKISYRFHDPERFDIIVFPFQYEEETYYIKRIIGLPGERVRIDWDGNIYIDGELLTEGYGREVIQDPGRAEEEISLGEDEYFVLGDNRNNSTDGRAEIVGNIHRDDIIGRAWVRIYPFEKFGKLRHQ